MFNLFKKNRCKVGFHKKGDRCFKTNSKVKKSRVDTSLECKTDGTSKYCGKDKPLRPIIPYFGGKTKVANKIVQKFPKHKTYVEPFVGGGSVYWKNNKAQNYIINDKNKEVYNLYKTAKNSPAKVKFCKLNPTKNKFDKIKNKPKHNSCDTMLLYKHSYGADGKNFANHHGLRNNTFTEEHAQKLKKTRVYNKDFRKVMKDRSDVLIYLDPPYVVGGDNYKEHGVTPKEVCDSVKKLKKAKAIISYDKNSKVKKQCKGLKFKTISFKYSDPKNGGISNKLKKELLITNY